MPDGAGEVQYTWRSKYYLDDHRGLSYMKRTKAYTYFLHLFKVGAEPHASSCSSFPEHE